VWCEAEDGFAGGVVMMIGKKGEDFSLPDISGERLSLSDFSGKDILVIIFGCNHCPYVKAYEKRMVDIQNAYADKSVALIEINSNDADAYPADSFENMKINAKEKGFNFPYLCDAKGETARAYNAKYTPEVFLLDDERIIRYTGRIDDNWQSERGVKRHDLTMAIEDLLHKREVAVKSTTPVGCTIKWQQG